VHGNLRSNIRFRREDGFDDLEDKSYTVMKSPHNGY
jgi:hypothetical protein